jgi:hypothetical protein
MMVAIIAGVAGIAGLVLGRFWDYRSESLRWRRDQRVQSYQKLAEEFHIFHEAVRTVALLKPGSADSELAISEARRTGLSWSKAMVAVWLHGSRRVVESSRVLDDCLTDLWRVAQERLISPADWMEIQSSTFASMQNLIEEIRRDLNFANLRGAMYQVS